MRALNFTRDGITPSPHMLAERAAPPREVLLTPEGPVAWVVTRYDDCRAVLGDQRFLGTGAVTAGPDLRPHLFRSPGWPGGPHGGALRRLVAPAFTARRSEVLRLDVERITGSLLDEIETAGGPADLCSAFTFPLPAKVICSLLGMPDDDVDELARWSEDVVTPPFLIPDEVASASWDALTSYFGAQLARKRSERADDLLSALSTADAPDDVLTGLAIALFVAGHETTTSQLGYGIVALLEHPGQADLVRSSGAVAETAVEEIMRYFPINAEGVPRYAAADVEVGGVLIPEGSTVLVGGPAAAFDETLFPDPLRFDVTRKGAPHLSFGYGAHFCVGAALARLQMRTAFPALLRRFPRLQLEQETLKVKQNLAGGLEELPVTW